MRPHDPVLQSAAIQVAVKPANVKLGFLRGTDWQVYDMRTMNEAAGAADTALMRSYEQQWLR
jgi:hypothetical protein